MLGSRHASRTHRRRQPGKLDRRTGAVYQVFATLENEIEESEKIAHACAIDL
jgi:hypothetical protein